MSKVLHEGYQGEIQDILQHLLVFPIDFYFILFYFILFYFVIFDLFLFGFHGEKKNKLTITAAC